MRHYLAPSQLFQLLMHGLGDFQDVLISVGAPWRWCYAAMVKYEDFFYLGSWYTSKKKIFFNLSQVFSKKMWSDFLSYSCVTFWWFSFLFISYFLCAFSICPARTGISSRWSRSNTKALSAVKFFMISRKIFQFWPHLA